MRSSRGMIAPMWAVADLKAVPQTFSFESSGLGQHHDRALVADGVTLVNMLGRAEWVDDPVQVNVCTECGIVQCAPGNYVAVRRIPGFVMLVASTRAYDEAAAAHDQSERAAPGFMRKAGAPLIALSDWARGSRGPS